MRPVALLSCLALAAAPLPLRAQQVPPRAEVSARLDSLLAAYMRETPSAGLAAAVVRGQDTLLLRGYGWADIGRRQPVTPQTVFRIGSNTKQFTAAAIMQLAERGALSLSDTLGRFLPAYPRWRGVTIRQLLTHTSGIHEFSLDSAGRTRRLEGELSPDSTLALVRDLPLDFAPGTRYRYSNTGYLLLGRVLERVTGVPWARQMDERFFSPLALRSASVCPASPEGGAVGYELDGTRVVAAPAAGGSAAWAAGALCLNVRDYLRWQTALTEGRVVTPASFARMSRSDTLADGTATGYGFGLGDGLLAGRRATMHGGGIAGFTSAVAWIPGDSLRVAVFTNLGHLELRPLVGNLVAAAVGEPLRASSAAVAPLAAGDRARYVGVYDLRFPGGRMVPLRVEEGEGVLTAQAGDGPKVPLVYVGNDSFVSAIDPTWKLTIVLENGVAVKALRPRASDTVEGLRRP